MRATDSLAPVLTVTWHNLEFLLKRVLLRSYLNQVGISMEDCLHD